MGGEKTGQRSVFGYKCCDGRESDGQGPTNIKEGLVGDPFALYRAHQVQYRVKIVSKRLTRHGRLGLRRAFVS